MCCLYIERLSDSAIYVLGEQALYKFQGVARDKNYRKGRTGLGVPSMPCSLQRNGTTIWEVCVGVVCVWLEGVHALCS